MTGAYNPCACKSWIDKLTLEIAELVKRKLLVTRWKGSPPLKRDLNFTSGLIPRTIQSGWASTRENSWILRSIITGTCVSGYFFRAAAVNFRLSDAITVYGARVIAQVPSVLFLAINRSRKTYGVRGKNDRPPRHRIPLHNSHLIETIKYLFTRLLSIMLTLDIYRIAMGLWNE